MGVGFLKEADDECSKASLAVISMLKSRAAENGMIIL